MILVDTSIWIDHLRRGDRQLAVLLEAGEVVCHPFLIGELACGSLARQRVIFKLLQALPRTGQAEHDEILRFIEDRRLDGGEIGSSTRTSSERLSAERSSCGRATLACGESPFDSESLPFACET